MLTFLLAWCLVASAEPPPAEPESEAVAELESGAAAWRKLALGNQWAEAGDPARAVAAYRAAQDLAPRSSDVQHNLALVRDELGAGAAPQRPRWMQVVTPGELGLLGVFGSGLGMAMLLLWRRRPGQAELGLAGGAAWAVGTALVWLGFSGAQDLTSHPMAVVVDSPAYLRDAASPDARVSVALDPGTEVRIERLRGGFVLIESGDGQRGWVPDGSLYWVAR